MDILTLNDFLVISTGVLAGIINVISGGGSIVTLPILIFLGLPAVEANATNRIGIFTQSLMGLLVYKSNTDLNLIKSKKYLIPIIIGGLVGSYIATDLNNQVMRIVIAVFMFVVAAMMILKPERWIKGSNKPYNPKLSWKELIVFFLIGVYGGFIQLGAGVFILTGMVLLGGMGLAESNPIKLFIVLVFTVVALGMFAYHGLINWWMGFLVAIGSMLGAWIGVKLSLRFGGNLIRWFTLALICTTATKLVGLW